MEANNNFKAAKAYALEHTVIIDTRQKRPNTCVDVRCAVDDNLTLEYYEFGFSKCQWPDKWNGPYGVELARKKAAAEIARRMVADGWEPGENPT